MSEPVKIIILVIASYLLGNISVALTISKLMKGDVRKLGSGNPGTMNMVRNYGVKIGILTLTLDVLKGFIPTFLGWLFIATPTPEFTPDKLGAYIGAISVIVGNIFPFALKFKGGKGIASTIGCFLAICPIPAVICFFIGVTFLFITAMGSVTSFVVVSPILIFAAVENNTLGGEHALACAILIFSFMCLTLYAHRKNIVKLFKGTESRTVIIKKKNKSNTAMLSNK